MTETTQPMAVGGWAAVQALLVARRSAMSADAMSALGVQEWVADGVRSRLPLLEFAARERVTAARSGGAGSPGSRGSTVADLLVTGWTPEGYLWLCRLGESMVASGTVFWAHGAAARNIAAVTRRLTGLAEGTAAMGARWAEVSPWLAVLAHSEDKQAAGVLYGMIRDWNEPLLGAGMPEWDRFRSRSLQDWAGLLGDLAGWAVAAGLTLDDTHERYEAGTLDRDGLTTLAALRGLLLPPLS